MKKFFIQKYQDLLIEDAVEINGIKHLRVVFADYPQDWDWHPYSGGSEFEEWQVCAYLPLSESGKVLYLPDDVAPGFNLESVVLSNGERMWAGDVLIPLFQYK